MLYLWIKAGHIIAVIFWMAAMMMLPRFFVYHSGAVPDGELDKQMRDAEKRLIKIIMTPAMIAAFVLGLALIGYNLDRGLPIWLGLKLILIFALMGYHGVLSADAKKFARGERPRSEKAYRILNEVPAVLIIFIVILAIVKPFI